MININKITDLMTVKMMMNFMNKKINTKSPNKFKIKHKKINKQ